MRVPIKPNAGEILANISVFSNFLNRFNSFSSTISLAIVFLVSKSKSSFSVISTSASLE